MNETGEKLGVVAVTVGLIQQPHDRSHGLTDVGLQIRVELVRDRQMWIERQCGA